MKPRLLDLCCGAGGAAAGYVAAGFEVWGVDVVPQHRYPFHFQQGDALSVDLAGFDAYHASPPCQGYSRMSNCRPGLADGYPRLVEQIRDRLEATGRPYVIENVEGSPLVDPITLCGSMFGYELYRHRLFESNVRLEQPEHPAHLLPTSKAGHWTPGTVMSVAGHFAPAAKARQIMAIDWMRREELAEAIPPYFTEHVGVWLAAAVGVERVA